MNAESKINCLIDYCFKNNISPDECVAVGDGSTDIPIFECCKQSIAINASINIKNRATYAVDTDDLLDILQYII